MKRWVHHEIVTLNYIYIHTEDTKVLLIQCCQKYPIGDSNPFLKHHSDQSADALDETWILEPTVCTSAPVRKTKMK